MGLRDDISSYLSNFPDGLTLKELSTGLEMDYQTIAKTIERETKKESPIFQYNGVFPKKVYLNEYGRANMKMQVEAVERSRRMAESIEKKIDEAKPEQDAKKEREDMEQLIFLRAADFLNQKKSLKKILSDINNGKSYLSFDVDAFFEFCPKVIDYAVENPKRLIEKVRESIELVELEKKLPIHLVNFPDIDGRKLAETRYSGNMGKLFSFDAFVVVASAVYPKTAVISYECKACGERITLLQTEDNIERPYVCTCGNRRSFDEILRKDIDEQIIILQEPEFSTAPVQVTAVLNHELCDAFQADKRKFTPGQKLNFTGIPDSKREVKYGKETTARKPFFKVHHYEAAADETIDLTDEDRKKIEELKKSPDCLGKLKGMISPHIYGYETEKEAILLQLFGGVKTDTSRGNIHILLAGDPSTAKTQILRHTVDNLALKGRFSALTSASHIGLTASVRMDKNIGNYVVEAGAIVLANGGLLAVDELDKIKREDEGHLNNAMEDGKFTVDKANIHLTLPSDCAILAASNPHTESETFDGSTPDAAQIKFSKTLQSRFDLIYTIKDIPDNEKDAQIADKILKGGAIEYPLPIELFKKYLYAARQITPGINDDLLGKLKAQYLQLRNIPRSERVTPRDLSALKRLAQASARSRLSDTVEEKDIETAIKIYGASMRAQKRQE